MTRFVILDRDGTLIVAHHYLSDPAQVELIAGAAEALRRFRRLGLGLIVVSNQSGVGRGYFDLKRLQDIHDRMLQLLREQAVSLDGVYSCPHTPEDDCPCRKPRAGLVERAARELGFVPRESFVIGDNACDIEMGRAIGAVTLLVRTGYGASVEAVQTLRADHVVDGILAAADVIGRLCAADERKGTT